MTSLHFQRERQAYVLAFKRRGLSEQGLQGLCGLICPNIFIPADNALCKSRINVPLWIFTGCMAAITYLKWGLLPPLFEAGGLNCAIAIATSRMFGT